MRIAYLAASETGNGFYRGTGPMTALEQCRGHRVQRLPTDEARASSIDLRGVDVLHIHRSAGERALRLAHAARAAGAAVVWDNDDDMGAAPRGSAAYRRYGGMHWERRLTAMRRLFQHADLVTAPSAVLAARMAALGAPRTAVIENHVPDQFIQRDQPARDGVTIGWIAALEHQMDAERLPIGAVLQRLLDERPDVRVVTFGLGLGLRSERYRHVDVVPLLKLADEAAGFDIGIAPLADLPFNHARSSIKLKEYAAAGAVWLASPVGPYVGLGEREGGRLVADDRWYEELSRLIDRPRERRKLAKRGRTWVAGQILSKNAGQWEARFEEAIGYARDAARAPVRSSG